MNNLMEIRQVVLFLCNDSYDEHNQANYPFLVPHTRWAASTWKSWVRKNTCVEVPEELKLFEHHALDLVFLMKSFGKLPGIELIKEWMSIATPCSIPDEH